MKANQLLLVSKSALFFVLFFLQLVLQAQSSYTKGFVVTAEGDTLQGFVNDKDWDFHPNTISFKDVENTKPVQYSPKDLKVVKTESGKYFEVITAEINKTPKDEVTYFSKENLVEETIFVQPIIKGILSFYFYQSPDLDKHFFVRKGSDDWVELLEIKYNKKKNGAVFVATEKRYIKQLEKRTFDCKALNDKLEQVQLTIKSLTHFVREYNTCKSALEKDYTSMYKKSGVKWEGNIFGGLNSNALSFSNGGGAYGFMESFDFPKNNSFTFGGGVNMILNKWNERWAVGLEWGTFKQEKSQEIVIQDGTAIRYNAHFETNINSINLLVRYYLSDRNLRPYIKLGLGKSKGSQTASNVVTGESIHFTKEYDDIEEAKLSSNRLIIGGGINFSRFYLEGRYSRGKGKEVIPKLHFKANELSLLFGFLL